MKWMLNPRVGTVVRSAGQLRKPATIAWLVLLSAAGLAGGCASAPEPPAPSHVTFKTLPAGEIEYETKPVSWADTWRIRGRVD